MGLFDKYNVRWPPAAEVIEVLDSKSNVATIAHKI
jgi:hypothetical protein